MNYMHWFVFLCDHSKLCLLNLIPFGHQLRRAGPFNLLVSRLSGEGEGTVSLRASYYGLEPYYGCQGLPCWGLVARDVSRSTLDFGQICCFEVVSLSLIFISNFEYFTEWALYILWKMISCSPDWTFSLNSRSPLPFLPFLCFHVSVRKKRWQFIHKGSESNAVETSPTPYHSQIIVRMHPNQEWWC